MYRQRFNGRQNRYRRFNRGGGRKSPVYDPSVFITDLKKTKSSRIVDVTESEESLTRREFSSDIKKSADISVEEFKPVHQFSDFKIHPILKQNIFSKGYVNPTPIQDAAIPPLLEGKDVVGIAETGTGKTAVFLIPLINKILSNPNEKVLIVAPTRELAIQINDELLGFARGTRIESVIAIGGVGIGGQIHRLRRNPSFVIGTPGRLKDLENRRAINFAVFKNIVLDEVDRMLDMGFIKDISYIISGLSPVRHSLFFSATLPDSVQKIMRQFSHDPTVISVKKEATPINVNQEVVRLNGRNKIDVLDELLTDRTFQKVLVFGRTKRGIDRIARDLSIRRITVAAIHGNKSQGQRQKALELFKSSKVQVLLATDIASRGLDIKDITHVINYDLPESYEDYIHRIGRTGRANKKGTALTFD